MTPQTGFAGRSGPLDAAQLLMGDPQAALGMPADILETNLIERIYWPYTDTQTFTAATTGTVQYFSTLPTTPWNGNGEDTNRMPNGQVQIVKYIAWTIAPAATSPDVTLLASSLAFTFRVNERTYLKNPCFQFGGLGAVGGYSGAAAIDVSTLGLPGLSNVHWLAIPIVLHDLCTFQMEVSVNSTIAGLAASRAVQCVLGGIRGRRPTGQ